MTIINLTPHDVNVCDDWGYIIKTYKASGIVARVPNNWVDVGTVDDVPIVTRRNDRIINLPGPQQDTYYIVSNIVLENCKDRTDLLAPAMQVKIDGRIVGCTAFVSNRRKG